MLISHTPGMYFPQEKNVVLKKKKKSFLGPPARHGAGALPTHMGCIFPGMKVVYWNCTPSYRCTHESAHSLQGKQLSKHPGQANQGEGQPTKSSRQLGHFPLSGSFVHKTKEITTPEKK